MANDNDERKQLKAAFRFPLTVGLWVVASHLLAPITVASAMEVRAGGISFDVPDGWIPVESSSSSGAMGLVGAWRKEREGVVLGNLTVTTCSSYSNVDEACIKSGKRMLRQTLGVAPGIGDFVLEDLEVVTLDRAPTYRLRASLAVSGTRVEQVQYLVSGAGAVVLTFSWNEDSYSEAEEDCERIARSVRVLERPSLLAEMPVWVCGAALGMFAGLCATGRRRRKGRGGEGSDPAATGC
jgi:hypothetical protein